MTIYYRGPDVLITDKVFAILKPPAARFRIDELREPHIVRGDLPSVRVVTRHAAGVAVVLAAAGWPFLSSPRDYLAAVLLVAAPSAANGACCRLAPRAFELRATYRTYEVRLFYSTNATTFGQVKRGLVRAMEVRRPHVQPFGEADFTGSDR
jgi:hypothetical protein